MTKQEQIEEMEKIIKAEYEQWLDTTGVIPKATTYYAECLGCAIDSAEELYNAGYRKIQDGTVVMTNEEYDKLGLFEETVQEYKSDNGQLVLVKEQKKLQKYSTDIADFIRKETAKEIMQCLYEKCYEIQNLRECVAHITPLDILTLAEQYGVEVEE